MKGGARERAPHDDEAGLYDEEYLSIENTYIHTYIPHEGTLTTHSGSSRGMKGKEKLGILI